MTHKSSDLIFVSQVSLETLSEAIAPISSDICRVRVHSFGP